MKTYGLIGYPLGHSFSKRYFRDKFINENIRDCFYSILPLQDITLLPHLLKSTPSLCGLNVTLPHKEAVIPFLDSLDENAAKIGAVNCIRIEDGKSKGYNTDVYGFELSLCKLIGSIRPKALVLGDGGASRAVVYVLKRLGVDYQIVSRTKKETTLTYEQITPDVLGDYRLIINTTPLGVFPDTETFPAIPYQIVTSDYFMFDLAYNPSITRFLALGAQRGATTMNGMQMLIDQAEKSWKIWNE